MAIYLNKISNKIISSITKVSNLAISSIHNISQAIIQSLSGDFLKISAGLSMGTLIRQTFTSNNIYTWGRNLYGALGINQPNSQGYFGEILGSSKTFCEISAQQYGSIAIDKNGKVWAWGYNNYGQLGDNSATNRSTPVAILGSEKTFCKISSGLYHTLSIDKNGQLWSWGYNSNGQLGNNSVTSVRTPVSVLGQVKTFCQISGTYSWSLAIDKNGRAWAWGYNNYGQLGNNSVTSVRTPVSVLGQVKTFCQIQGSQSHSIGLDKNGGVWCWGYNFHGQLGRNSTASVRTPNKISGVNKTFCVIDVGEAVSHAIDKNGKIWSWGYNMWGKLGDGTTINRSTPVAVGGANKTFCDVSGGQYYSIALDHNNNVWGWGNTDYLNDIPIKPIKSSGIKIALITAGLNMAMSLSSDDDKLYVWGYNNLGCLGINLGSGSRRSPLLTVGENKTFCQLNAGSYVSSGIDKYGKIWTWGNNAAGQLGTNSVIIRSTPVAILGVNKTFCKISSGVNFIISIDKNGKSWSWGLNNTGQLGDNSITCRSTPVAVGGTNKTFSKISSGSHTLALTSSGIAWAWGLNTGGSLGTNDTTSKRTPTMVMGVTKTFCEISCSMYFHTMAIDNYGKLWTWGVNPSGALGNNSISSRRTPVAVYGDRTFCKISAGYYFSTAIDKNGKIWTWGYNENGCLGDNTFVSKRTPVNPYNVNNLTFCQISAGTNFVLASDKNGDLYAWGYNSHGQFGYDYAVLTPIKLFI